MKSIRTDNVTESDNNNDCKDQTEYKKYEREVVPLQLILIEDYLPELMN